MTPERKNKLTIMALNQRISKLKSELRTASLEQQAVDLEKRLAIRLSAAKNFDSRFDKATALRATGKTYREIGIVLNLSGGRVAQILQDNSRAARRKAMINPKEANLTLQSGIGEMKLSVRAANAMDYNNITTVSELIAIPKSRLKKIRNFGKMCMAEIELILQANGLPELKK